MEINERIVTGPLFFAAENNAISGPDRTPSSSLSSIVENGREGIVRLQTVSRESFSPNLIVHASRDPGVMVLAVLGSNLGAIASVIGR